MSSQTSMDLLDLDGSPRPQSSLDWLVELALRLNIVIDVIGPDDVPASPEGSSRDAATVRRFLANGEPSLRNAILQVAGSQKPTAVTIDDLVLVCFRLDGRGVLLLARRIDTYASAEECREDLESLGPWLTSAVDTSLAEPEVVSAEAYRIISFRRIVGEAVLHGSLRQVVSAFIEALSVWDDVRVRIYVAGASGGYIEYASSMSADPSSATASFDESLLPRQGQIARLSSADVDGAGLALDAGETAVARMTIGAGTGWVLVFSGVLTDAVQVRLRVYADILREALNDVLIAGINRIVAELSRRNVPLNEYVGSAAQSALERLTGAVGARRAALHVASTTGRHALTVGDGDLLSPGERGCPNCLQVRLSDAEGVMTVAFEREHAAFTAFEREVAHAGATAIQPWVQAALPRASDLERRGSAKPVETVFDQLATDAVAAGQAASVIVMAIDATMVVPGLLPTWVARIRAGLRAGDRAGMLNDREIAVLLYGASADQAVVVTERLGQLLETPGIITDFVPPSVGMITRVPETAFEGSLVAAARASAHGRS